MSGPYLRSAGETALSRFLRRLFPAPAPRRRWRPPEVEALENLLPPNGLAGAISDARGGENERLLL